MPELSKFSLLVLAYGPEQDISPNQRLITAATQFAVKHSAPIFTQRELQFSFDDVEYDGESATAAPTLSIVTAAVQWAKRRGIKKITLFAARPHRYRCRRDLLWAIKQDGADIQIEVWDDHKKTSWFCSASSQRRIHSWWTWWPREIIILCMPMRLYAEKSGVAVTH